MQVTYQGPWQESSVQRLVSTANVHAYVVKTETHLASYKYQAFSYLPAITQRSSPNTHRQEAQSIHHGAQEHHVVLRCIPLGAAALMQLHVQRSKAPRGGVPTASHRAGAAKARIATTSHCAGTAAPDRPRGAKGARSAAP